MSGGPEDTQQEARQLPKGKGCGAELGTLNADRHCSGRRSERTWPLTSQLHPFHSYVGMDHVPNPYWSITACQLRRASGRVQPVAGVPLGTSLLELRLGGPGARTERLAAGL